MKMKISPWKTVKKRTKKNQKVISNKLSLKLRLKKRPNLLLYPQLLLCHKIFLHKHFHVHLISLNPSQIIMKTKVTHIRTLAMKIIILKMISKATKT